MTKISRVYTHGQLNLQLHKILQSTIITKHVIAQLLLIIAKLTMQLQGFPEVSWELPGLPGIPNPDISLGKNISRGIHKYFK